jgi:predicted short-subunit dehydrogenase-like oxidoreductase (DUF2520 family)
MTMEDPSQTSQSWTEPIFIVGGGRVGIALGALLRGAGLPLIGLWTRSAESAARATEMVGVQCFHGAFPEQVGRARVLVLAVQDPVVPAVAGALLDGGLLREARVVFHCGGGQPASEALAPLADVASLGTLHPLVAVADPRQAMHALPAATFGVEGEPDARKTAHRLAAIIGASSFDLAAEEMGLYHAAAVIASNHPVALWNAALDLLVEAGLRRETARAALNALIRSTVGNVETLGLPEALTGPVRRGDRVTVQRHLDVLQARAPRLVPLYRACTEAAQDAVESIGGDPAGGGPSRHES